MQSRDDDVGASEAGQVDPRVSLANERTLLAWTRTALAFVAGGLAVTQFLDDVDLPGGRRLIGLSLIVTGAVVAVLSHRRWRLRERALAEGRPMGSSVLGWVVTAAVVGVAIVAVFVAAQPTSGR